MARRRSEDDTIIAELIAASPLNDPHAKRIRAQGLVIASRALDLIRGKLDDDIALSDEIRALPALLSRCDRLLTALQLDEAKKKSMKDLLGFDLDDDTAPGPVTPGAPPAPSAAPATASETAAARAALRVADEDDDLLAEIRSGVAQ